MRKALLRCLLALLASGAARGAEPVDWKLSYTQHFTDAEPDGIDLNLRGTRGAGPSTCSSGAGRWATRANARGARASA